MPTRRRTLALAAVAAALLVVGVVVLSLSTFAFVKVPSGAMMNTILPGDRVLVRYTSQVERGDVVMFRYPKEPSVRYLKRVVALPGETVEVRDGIVFVNGAELPEERVIVTAPVSVDPEARMLDENTAVGDGPYRVFVSETGDELSEMFGNDAPVIVPDDHYFVLGDNRDGSEDSRFYGAVPAANVLGKALGIYFSPIRQKLDPENAPTLLSMRPLD